MNNPKVSVVMSVFNGEKYLHKAIQSVLEQTYDNFEFIIINDGSTDNSESIARSFNDQRIKIISRENKGLVKSLNEGMAMATGKYIARMDADDICDIYRLEKQLNYLEKNNDIDLCGTWAMAIDDADKIIDKYDYPPLAHHEIKKHLLFHNAFIHPSIMFRRGIVEKVGGYSDNYKYIEDYELWTRILRACKSANLPEYLLQYRINQSGITRSKNIKIRVKGLLVRLLVILRIFLKLPI